MRRRKKQRYFHLENNHQICLFRLDVTKNRIRMHLNTTQEMRVKLTELNGG